MRGRASDVVAVKGQVYSIAVVLIAIPLLLFIAFYITSTQTIKFGTTEKTVSDQLNHIEKSIQKDFVQSLEISGRRAMLSAVNIIVTNGTFLKNSTSAVIELMENGTYEGNESFLMANNSLNNWQQKMLGLIKQFKLSISFSKSFVKNQGGFNTNHTAFLSVNISDNFGISKIIRSSEKSNLVSLVGLEDPTFALNTGGRVVRLVTEYPYPYLAMPIVQGSAASGNCTGEVTFNAGMPDASKILVTVNGAGIAGFRGVVAEDDDAPAVACYVVGAPGAVQKINSTINYSNYTEVYLDQSTNNTWSLPINNAINNKNYIHFPGASGPDFLERLEGSLNESSGGIESFVYIPDLDDVDIIIKNDQTTIDYLYFADKDNIGKKVRGLPDWFRMNVSLSSIYNLTQLLE